MLAGRSFLFIVCGTILCFGPLLTAAYTARSNRAHASGSFLLLSMGPFDMQPISRVKPNAVTIWGVNDAMILRPKIAVKVAQYISQWSDIETLLGLFLAILLHAHEDAAVAIFHGIENRTAQLKMLSSAAEVSLPEDTFRAVSALITSLVRPSMKYRDKLAHWAWGLSEDIPDALLLSEPKDKLVAHLKGLRIQVSKQSDLSGVRAFETDWADC
ncbi:hypothetical protein [Pseudorhodoplanes sp.]|uniref:hypothetical protein n=1 Tax=Pseudorhodoplanes sp. TaxID=1934341 RepID=UPI003D0F7145